MMSTTNVRVSGTVAALMLLLLAVAWPALVAASAYADALPPPSPTHVSPSPTPSVAVPGDVPGAADNDSTTTLLVAGAVVAIVAIGSYVALRRGASRPPDEGDS
jgi:hypothetical protein